MSTCFSCGESSRDAVCRLCLVDADDTVRVAGLEQLRGMGLDLPASFFDDHDPAAEFVATAFVEEGGAFHLGRGRRSYGEFRADPAALSALQARPSTPPARPGEVARSKSSRGCRTRRTRSPRPRRAPASSQGPAVRPDAIRRAPVGASTAKR